MSWKHQPNPTHGTEGHLREGMLKGNRVPEPHYIFSFFAMLNVVFGDYSLSMWLFHEGERDGICRNTSSHSRKFEVFASCSLLVIVVVVVCCFFAPLGHLLTIPFHRAMCASCRYEDTRTEAQKKFDEVQKERVSLPLLLNPFVYHAFLDLTCARPLHTACNPRFSSHHHHNHCVCFGLPHAYFRRPNASRSWQVRHTRRRLT